MQQAAAHEVLHDLVQISARNLRHLGQMIGRGGFIGRLGQPHGDAQGIFGGFRQHGWMNLRLQ